MCSALSLSRDTERGLGAQGPSCVGRVPDGRWRERRSVDAASHKRRTRGLNSSGWRTAYYGGGPLDEYSWWCPMTKRGERETHRGHHVMTFARTAEALAAVRHVDGPVQPDAVHTRGGHALQQPSRPVGVQRQRRRGVRALHPVHDQLDVRLGPHLPCVARPPITTTHTAVGRPLPPLKPLSCKPL